MQLLFILLLANSLYAADTCCVDEDIAAAFPMFLAFSRDWPADFPLNIDIEGFEFIGSSRFYKGLVHAVAWKSEIDSQLSRELVTETLLAKDWVPIPVNDRNQARSERGFITHKPRIVGKSQQFCRGGDGTLTIQARQSSIGTVVTLTHAIQEMGRNCAVLMAARITEQDHSIGIMAYLPTLMLPESIVADSPSGSGGGGDEEAHATKSVTTNVSAFDVSFYFEPQMKTQQWVLESDFQGSKISGHVWRRNVDGLELICIVTAIESGNGLRLRMHVEAL